MPAPDDPVPGAHPDEMLALVTRREADAVVVTAVGEIDMTTAPDLDIAVRAALAMRGPGPTVLDLTAVTFLASAGLAVLVGAHGAATIRREPLRVVIDHTRPVLRPIHLVGLDDVLALYDTVTDALNDQPRPRDA